KYRKGRFLSEVLRRVLPEFERKIRSTNVLGA
ncbi:MAG: hypothetical protein QOJ52_3968, partial [Acidimicrobiaceae bacterium]|nr:hypothetical protein [Acidimicrobiaceae bacterium]